MPMDEYLDEHKRLIYALQSKDPQLLMNELKEQTQEIKKLQGGRKGVTKKSGFIMRMMAENKLKHSGQYKNPTDPAHKDSTMSAWEAFDYKKLANKSQGGEKESKYGASPFIQRYFKLKHLPTGRKFNPGKNPNLPSETSEQQEGRMKATENRLAKRGYKKVIADSLQGETKNVIEHFGNVGEKKGPTLEIKEKEPESDEDTGKKIDIHDDASLAKAHKFVESLGEKWEKYRKDLEKYLLLKGKISDIVPIYRAWVLQKMKDKFVLDYHFHSSDYYEDLVKYPFEVPDKSEKVAEGEEEAYKKVYDTVINEIRDRPLGHDYTPETKERMGKNDERLVRYYNNVVANGEAKKKAKHEDKLTPEEYDRLIKRENQFTEQKYESSEQDKIQQQRNRISIQKTKDARGKRGGRIKLRGI